MALWKEKLISLNMFTDTIRCVLFELFNVAQRKASQDSSTHRSNISKPS